MEPFDIPRPLAAVLLAEVSLVMERLEEIDFLELPDHQPMPFGLLTCGEVGRITAALFVMLTQAYPDFHDGDVLGDSLREAMVDGLSTSTTLN